VGREAAPLPPDNRGGGELVIRRLSMLALGLSPLALAAAQAADDPCGPKVCQRRPADSTSEPTVIAPNLEQGGAYDPFRVTIDGATPAGTWAVDGDAQRAADTAMAGKKIQVQVTTLRGQPMLSVVPQAPVAGPGDTVTFYTLANYGAFIARAELRIFPTNTSTEGEPLVTLPVTIGKPAFWKAGATSRQLRIVLRVYDGAGHYDETAPQDFAIVAAPPVSGDRRDGPLFDNQRTKANITVEGAEVTVSGDAELGSSVEAFGVSMPVDKAGRFAVQQIVPQKTKSVTIKVAPPSGPPETYVRALNVPWDDGFLVAIADITAGHRSMNQATIDLQGIDNADARKNFIDGRFAFYWKGQFAHQWHVTAAADTGEHPFNDLFSDFLKKDSRAFLRRLDPELHYPTYGDDSSLVQDAPTYGRFYLRAEDKNTEAMWGNFHTDLTGTELIRYSRALYGAGAKWHGDATNGNGERKTEVSGFAADPGTIDSREEFASTGGSVYYLRNQDIAQGSERVFMEVRDRDSGIVLERQELIEARDYDVNYIQGRILLRTPLPIVADTSLFVHNSSLAGNPVWLVTTYEYTPGLTRPGALTYGGRAQHWIGDHIRLGVTGYRQGEDQSRQTLYGTDLLLRYKPGTFIRGEFAHSDGAGVGTLFSSTGGYDFTQVTATSQGGSNAFVLEGAAALSDFVKDANGKVTGYYRRREAGYSGPGELTFGEAIDQYGGTADMAIGKIGTFKTKIDITDGDLTQRKAVETGLTHDLGKGWYGSIGLRADDQGAGQATAYTPIAAPNNLQGERTDAAVTLGYHHVPNPPAKTQDGPQLPYDDRVWSASVFAQKTLQRDGGRLDNDRVGVAGDIAITQRLTVGGEVSEGDQGFGANAKANYRTSDRGSLYLSYQLDSENPDAFNTGRLGRLTGGAKYRFGDSTNVFAEERYEYGSGPTGFSQAYGVDFSPWKGWTLGGKYENGKLGDALGGSIKRDVVSGTVGYTTKAVRWSTAVEYRTEDDNHLGDRKTWATRNLVTWQASDALRLFGKANMSVSNGGPDAQGLDANYYEISLAAAYRPVWNDKLNLLAKLTYLDDLPSPAQVTAYNLPIDYAQRSKIGALDATYQLTPRLAVGGKVAYRVGELRMSRDDSQPWFDSKAFFWAVRADYEVIRRWDLLAEMRKLTVSTAGDSQLGALVAVYRHVGPNLKVGAGYNFTDYSDDLADLSHRNHGFFFNVIGKF
jgi:hypothetical protein